jgi:hypothetical protein
MIDRRGGDCNGNVVADDDGTSFVSSIICLDEHACCLRNRYYPNLYTLPLSCRGDEWRRKTCIYFGLSGFMFY